MGNAMASSEPEHERVVVRQEPETGLRLVIAVHSTVLGPALGGLRLRHYPRGLPEAVDDALALARTMTLKASAAGLDLGGGKAVMLDDGCDDRREARMRAAADAIDELGGAYITAEDIGTTTADMDVVAEGTRWVVGRSEARGGGGDPSPVTAQTVFRAIGRGLEAATGSGDLEGRRVGVIGLGKVGSALAAALADAGARVLATDIVPERVERMAAAGLVEPADSAEALLAAELDVLAPCGAGGTVDDALASSLSCRVVCGAANNPLTGREAARRLARRGVLYVPDFLANCGGLIHVEAEWSGGDRARVEAGIERAMERLDAALTDSRAGDETPAEVAERHALERVEHAGARGRGALAAAA